MWKSPTTLQSPVQPLLIQQRVLEIQHVILRRTFTDNRWAYYFRPTKFPIINSLETTLAWIDATHTVYTPKHPSSRVLHAFRFWTCHYGMNIEWFGIHEKDFVLARVNWPDQSMVAHQRIITLCVVVVCQSDWYHLIRRRLLTRVPWLVLVCGRPGCYSG